MPGTVAAAAPVCFKNRIGRPSVYVAPKSASCGYTINAGVKCFRGSKWVCRIIITGSVVTIDKGDRFGEMFPVPGSPIMLLVTSSTSFTVPLLHVEVAVLKRAATYPGSVTSPTGNYIGLVVSVAMGNCSRSQCKSA